MHKGRLIGFIALTAALAVAALWHPAANGPSACMSRNLLGVSCPGCGMTRSVTSAAHGDLKASISFHAFGPFVLVVGLITWGLLGVGLVRGKNLIPDIDTPFWTYSIVGWFVLLILYWIARVLTHTTP